MSAVSKEAREGRMLDGSRMQGPEVCKKCHRIESGDCSIYDGREDRYRTRIGGYSHGVDVARSAAYSDTSGICFFLRSPATTRRPPRCGGAAGSLVTIVRPVFKHS